MKRWIAWLMLSMLLFTGCQRQKETVNFYYLQKNYDFTGSSQVVTAEAREAPERRSLGYLLALYLVGPSDEQLVNPLPEGTNIMVVSKSPESISLKLSSGADKLSDSEFMLATACLAYTCRDFTGVGQITVFTDHRSLSLNVNHLTMVDDEIVLEETQR